jgi:RecB family exonuclease
VYQAAVEKKKGPVRDADNAGERGNRVHKVAEDYVKGERDNTTKEVSKFKEDLDMLREDYKDGKVEVEGDWAFTTEWEQTGWWDKNAWARIKLDVWETLDEHTGRVIDHKTGKKFGNEVKHTQQGQLYMVAGFMRHPEITLIETEFWYLDHGLKLKKKYSRDKLPLYLKKFNKRALAMTCATEFPAKPSKMNCRWCDYGVENGTGDCPYAVPLNG